MVGLLLAAAVGGACRDRGAGADGSPALPQEQTSDFSAPAPDVADASASAGGARSPAWWTAVEERATERELMVQEQMAARGVDDERVLGALRSVPRHRFVPGVVRSGAYLDSPLPIPGGQTISQPYIVAFMSEAAQIRPGARCLEIGTGSGYQAAVLAELCGETYSIEYLPEVAAFGRANLEALGYLDRSLYLRVGDGYVGWPERAPFDAILVTAAPDHVPQPLLDQLAVGGRLVIPVGTTYDQSLEVWKRIAPGSGHRSFSQQRLAGVRFVPFLGPHAR